MKRSIWISALLSAALLLSCTACGSSGSATEETATTEPAAETTVPATEPVEETEATETAEETAADETEDVEALETEYVVNGYTFTDPVEVLTLDENGSYTSVDGLFTLTIPEEFQEDLMLIRLTDESEVQNGVLIYFIPALDMFPDLTDWGTTVFEVFAVETGSSAEIFVSGSTDDEPYCTSGDYTYYLMELTGDVIAVLGNNYDAYADELAAIQENFISWVHISEPAPSIESITLSDESGAALADADGWFTLSGMTVIDVTYTGTATLAKFYATPTGSESESERELIGTVTLEEGSTTASLSWEVPDGFMGYLSVVLSNADNSVDSSEDFLIKGIQAEG
ncbi:MAG: hypothetical protein LUD79_08760 [Oscillospiraceae bacterium]|nr:hypothetical protein [Oscillospiraceae bacterium]